MSIFTLNSNSVFPNTSGLLDQKSAKNLFTSTPISMSNIESGIFDSCILKNITHIESPSNKIELDQTSKLKIEFTSITRQSLTITLDGFTESFNKGTNTPDGMIFLDNLSSPSDKLPNQFKIFRSNKEQYPVGSTSSRRVLEAFTQSSSINYTPTANLWSWLSTQKSNLTHAKRSKFYRCTIEDGFFKRPFFDECDINSNQDNISLDNFGSITKLRIVSSELSQNNSIKTSTLKGCYLKDIKIHNSLIDSSTIEDGLISDGTFHNSTFLSGTSSDVYFLDNYSSFGLTQSEILGINWRGHHSGIFTTGIFDRSLWLSGIFDGGEFYQSDWISGTFSSGTLGKENLDTNQTRFGSILDPRDQTIKSSDFLDGVVKGALVGGQGIVNWYGGIFNSGEITSGSGQTIWYNGTFNSGKVTGNVTWKDGDFKGGVFSSTKFLSDTKNPDSFSWQGGRFWAGEFGTGGPTNSSWYDGEFRGGIFKGKLWRDGLFFSGEFIGGFSSSIIERENNFINYFTGSYYGVWLSGKVVDNINEGITQYSPPTPLSVLTGLVGSTNLVNMRNFLWVSGTFSHSSGEILNSGWLGGNFVRGTFKNSLFNPFIDRRSWIPTETQTQSFAPDISCQWSGGNFDGGKFWYSQWLSGNFVSGTMTGGIWHSGTWLWGFANNILWKSGRWRNGNWRGTSFDWDEFSSTRSITLAKRINQFLGTSSNMWNNLHYMNVGSSSVSGTNLVNFGFSSTSSEFWTQDTSTFSSWTLTTFASTNLSQQGFSRKLLPQIYRCNDTGCKISNEIFSDTNYFYRVSIQARSNSSSSSWIFIDSSSFQGTQSTSLSPGQSGFWNGSFPQLPQNPQNITTGSGLIHLDTTLKTYTMDIGVKTSDPKTLSIVCHNSSNSNITIEITDIKISRIISEYNTQYNNRILNSSLTGTPTIPFSNTLQSSYETPSSGGFKTKMSWGNGQFLSGIWETGIWENGYRDDVSCLTFSHINNFTKISDFTYRVSITGISSFGLAVSDRVAISNIIGVGTNFENVLLKSPSRITRIGSQDIEVEIVYSGPLRTIEIDQMGYPIKVTKNIWQSGVILSGYFSGIMLYGLCKGFSGNLLMEDFHMVDGIFDGGTLRHKNSGKKSLVQNFTFYDSSYLIDIQKEDPLYSNLHRSPLPQMGQKNRKYHSHIDLDWDEEEISNTFDNITLFSEFFDKSFRSLNHSSWTTKDIIRSNSFIRSLTSTDLNPYSLGSKVSNFKEKIPDGGLFNYPTLIRNGVPLSSSTSDLGRFFRTGWTYSFSITGDGQRFIAGSSTFSSNWNLTNPSLSNKLIVELTGSQSGLGFVLSNFSNRNTQTPQGRYTMVEFEVFTYSGSPWVQLGNYALQSTSYPKIYFWNKPSDFSPRMLTSPLNHLSSSKITKKEYFYNLNSLDFSIFGGSDFTQSSWTSPSTRVVFTKFKYSEVDSIPFFNYYLDSTSQVDRIDRGFKTPTRATAPRIDYSRQDFDFIGNVTITL